MAGCDFPQAIWHGSVEEAQLLTAAMQKQPEDHVAVYRAELRLRSPMILID